MNRRKEEIKNRIAKRKRERTQFPTNDDHLETKRPIIYEEDTYGFQSTASHTKDGSSKGFHPLFRSDLFMLKLLIASCLVLITAIIYKNNQPPFQKAQQTVQNIMETEFQFAAVSKWYEERFGNPIALFSPSETKHDSNQAPQYAVPAVGRVLESFQDNGQGITVETTNKEVEAMDEGMVIEVRKMEETGLTVVLQHADGTETWYGNLKEIDVALYDFVEMGKTIGQVKQNDGEQGTYYFAIKKGDQFIDPNQVISFE